VWGGLDIVVNTAAGGRLVTGVVHDDPCDQRRCRHDDHQADRDHLEASTTSLTRLPACCLTMCVRTRELFASPLLGDHGR
jgi:hypothetical protein